MNNPTDFNNFLDLPNHYLQQLYEYLEHLAKTAIDDGDIQSSLRLLSLILYIQQNKTDATSEPIVNPDKIEVKADTRPRYKSVGYSEATKEMRDAIISLVQKKLLNLEVVISSRSFYSLVEKHHLSNIEDSKLEALMLPMSSSRTDRPCWKEAVTQALAMLIDEGYMEKSGRYTYIWTDLAKTEIKDLEVSEPIEDAYEEPKTKEKLTISPITEISYPQPFAAFTKPKIYGQVEGESNKRAVV